MAARVRKALASNRSFAQRPGAWSGEAPPEAIEHTDISNRLNREGLLTSHRQLPGIQYDSTKMNFVALLQPQHCVWQQKRIDSLYDSFAIPAHVIEPRVDHD
jgi:hypothetical protein